MKHKNLKLTSFTALGQDVIQVENELREYAKNGIQLSIQGMVIDAAVLSSFYEYIIDLNRKKMKECQHRGIQKALQRKSEGKGNYGRPSIDLPNDFEEQIRKRLVDREALSEYQKELNIKRSTFYRPANLIKHAILMQEAEQNIQKG